MDKLDKREVRIGAAYDRSDYRVFQLNYLDPQSRRPLPNTRVYVGDDLVVETNSLGCFGPEPDLSKPLVGIFGDSVVQGVGLGSFVQHVELPGCSVINGGVEGSLLEASVDRLCALHARSPMLCAALHPGFHNLLYNQTAFMHWEAQLARLKHIPAVAVFRLSADINAEAVERGYEALFGEGYSRVHFNKDPPTVRMFADALAKKNRLIEKACAAWGYTLISLDEVLAPRDYSEVGARFFDIIHPQPTMYPEMGEAVATQLKPLIARALDSWSPSAAMTDARAPAAIGERGRTYPLW